MPMASNMLPALCRATAALGLLSLAMAFPAVRPAAAQQAPVAPEPTTSDDGAAKGDVNTDAAPSRVVEVLAGSDVSGSGRQSLLARELARQAVLLAAREELGLGTRDPTLREAASDKSTPEALLLDVQIQFDNRGTVVIEVVHVDENGRRSKLSRWTKQFAEQKTIDYAALATWCEELSRGEIAAAIRKVAKVAAIDEPRSASAADSQTNGNAGDLPTDATERLRRMTFASQFAAVRRLHELARRDGGVSAATAALARGYAHLGVLSELYWQPASVAFKARALLYSERAVAASSDDPNVNVRNRRSLGYAQALCGRHRDAIETFTLVRVPSTDQAPAWATVAKALCEFDDAALAAVPLDSDAGEIARVCRVLMAEHASISPDDMEYEAFSGADQRLTAIALELPHCWRVRTAAGRRVYDVGGRQTFDAQWYRDVLAAPRLPPSVAAIAERQSAVDAESVGFDLATEQKSRGELVKSLRAAVAWDLHEPSLGVLASLVEDASFVDAFEYAQVMVGGYDKEDTKKSVDEFRANVVPIVERHPLYPMLDEWLKMTAGSSIDFDANRLLKTIDASCATTAMFELLDFGYSEPSQGYAGKLHTAILGHADDTFADLATLAFRYDVADKARYAEKLFEVSPHAPQAVAGMIRYHWPRVADRAAAFERRYAGDQGVAAMLGSRYLAEKRPADARRCFEAYVKLTTTREWASLWGYRHLAETYRAEGDHRRWLTTLEDFLRQEGAADQRGEVQVLIAQHYLALGDYDQALHYAESVDSYSDIQAELVVAECREYQHRWLAAEQAYRSVAEDDPYSPQVLLWHRYCAQTGYGNITTARNAVLGYVKSIDEEDFGAMADADALAGIGCFYLLENEPDAALKWFTRAAQTGRKQNADGVADPRHELHLAVVADQLGKREERDAALARVVKSGEKFIADGQPRRELVAFARLLEQAFARAEDKAKPSAAPFDRAAVDELLAAASPQDQALLAYLAGRTLDARGDRAAATELFRRAVANSVRDASRSLAAVLLRRHGIEPNEIVVGPRRRDSRPTGG